jgi:hypothetical protein
MQDVGRNKQGDAKNPEAQPMFDFEELRQTLLEQVEILQKQFKVKHRHLLRWAKKQGYTLHFLADSTAKMAVTGGLIGSLLAGAPQQIAQHSLEQSAFQQKITHQTQAPETDTAAARKKDQMTVMAIRQKQIAEQEQAMQSLLQLSQGALDITTSATASELTSHLTNVPAVSELEGYRLNTNVGRIGAEQHLYRYPGDNLGEHFDSIEDRQVHQSSGFAPGLGAYGYFAPSKAAMTPEIAQREKYYVAIQTFLSPNWQGNVHQAYNWFKYRKVIIYHPVTRKAVVAVVGDAGPALSTGKNYGGSPEVMRALNANDGHGTPPVLMFFVNDDPDNPVPLGPVNFEMPPLEQGG